MNLHENKKTFAEAVTATAGHLNIKRHFVEKDYWICRTLQQMARTDTARHAIFKGGTSLTKAYHIGHRFSEDIDIAIADAHLMTGNQVKTTIRRIAHGMTEGMVEVPKDTSSKGSHYHKAYYAYPTISNIPTSGAVRAGELLLEINSFANPYPWEIRYIRCFITDFLMQSGNASLIEQYDMAEFPIPVLDYRRTLTEKLVSLIRCSLADDYIPQLNAKIRHFYDIYYLMQNKDCNIYLHSESFKTDFSQLLAHDRQSFSKPKGWQTRPLLESPLFSNLDTIWKQLQPTYLRELPDLAYREIPSADEIENCFQTLLSLF